VSRAPFSLEPVEEGIASLVVATDDQRYMDWQFVQNLSGALARVAADTTLRVLLIEGGRTYFSAGASRELLLEADAGRKIAAYAAEVPTMLLGIPVPTIAVMAGHGIGGGLALGLWCDVALMAEEALYGATFMTLGFTPGMGSTVVLEEAFGAPLARELLFTGRAVKGRELKAAGVPIGHAIMPAGEVRARALAIAREMAAAPRPALLLLKSMLAERRATALGPALAREQSSHRTIFASDETMHAIRGTYHGTHR